MLVAPIPTTKAGETAILPFLSAPFGARPGGGSHDITANSYAKVLPGAPKGTIDVRLKVIIGGVTQEAYHGTEALPDDTSQVNEHNTLAGLRANLKGTDAAGKPLYDAALPGYWAITPSVDAKIWLEQFPGA